MRRFLTAAAVAALAVPVTAQAETEMVVVSWGGAYSASQQGAYHEPYMAENPDIKIINDDSANEAVAKLRAMNEVGNVTWDLVDAVAADAILLCDEGLAEPINHDEALAPAPDGTPASEDFGELLVSECFIPQIVYSTTFGYRSDLAEWNGNGLTISVTSSISKPSQASAHSRKSRSTMLNGH